MVKLLEGGAYLQNGKNLITDSQPLAIEEARKQTMTYKILKEHNVSDDMQHLKIKFDCLTSHDITYVSIIQTARASGLDHFPVPYVLTNCHNSLSAVGGTINEDDHLFGLSAAQKYGGIYVPAHQAVIHQYMREMMASSGKMVLGSDSHTRYGALGCMAIGEGGGELAKQLLGKTYDINYPEVVCVYMTGKPQKGVGPQDVALAIIRSVFDTSAVKNKVMEFVGDGIANLNIDFRNGIDVMTTETTCLSSIWMTDQKVKDYYALHNREHNYLELTPGECAYYDGVLHVDLSQIKPMIAMPFHPSHVYTIDEVNENLLDILDLVEEKTSHSLKDKVRDGKFYVDQAVIAGCAGGSYDNICDAADILKGRSVGSGALALSVYPASQPVFFALVENGATATLMEAGASMRSAFCGPCFGAGDVPFHGGFSIRHATRNFPNREGAKPTQGQMAYVALMDARSIAATVANGGVLTSAANYDVTYTKPAYYFKSEIYNNRVYNGFGKADLSIQLKYGPNIADWPTMPPLADDLLLQVVSVINDPVTTTDELIPSGETSSYRSNPLGLAEFTLSRKDPGYVARAKAVQNLEVWKPVLEANKHINLAKTSIGSVIYAVKPGDGSAREQAASSQKVLGGWANIAHEYATKRYRSNLINWGMLPFLYHGDRVFENGDILYIPGIKASLTQQKYIVQAYILNDNYNTITLELEPMTEDERAIIVAGCLINHYKSIY